MLHRKQFPLLSMPFKVQILEMLIVKSEGGWKSKKWVLPLRMTFTALVFLGRQVLVSIFHTAHIPLA